MLIIWRESKYASTIPLAAIPAVETISGAAAETLRVFTGQVIKTTNAGYYADLLPATRSGEIRMSMRAHDAFVRRHGAASGDYPEPCPAARQNAASSLSRTGARCLHQSQH
ncbi:hypothetical protein [Burkholderia stabilis]|uniref:hypothetical protein n=1 Tax=Burkholderia stabilis TaxID=95485 RepID=UPI001F4B36B5|nr:hypothetical protein [Burkholderia stabilis]